MAGTPIPRRAVNSLLVGAVLGAGIAEFSRLREEVPDPHHPTAVAHRGPATRMPLPTGNTGNGDPLVRVVHTIVPNARLGALVYDRMRGSTVLSVGPRQPFRSASLVKLLIAVDALASPSRADEDTRELLRRMLALSDDDIASAFWEKAGGVAILQRAAARIGLRDTRPPDEPAVWGSTLITANDIARTYHHILARLPQPDRRLIVGALAAAPQHAADGWDQYFGIPTAIGEIPATDWAIKQGWSDVGADQVLHSTGLIGHDSWRYILVLLLSDSSRPDWPPLRTALTAATAAIPFPRPVT